MCVDSSRIQHHHHTELQVALSNQPHAMPAFAHAVLVIPRRACKSREFRPYRDRAYAYTVTVVHKNIRLRWHKQPLCDGMALDASKHSTLLLPSECTSLLDYWCCSGALALLQCLDSVHAPSQLCSTPAAQCGLSVKSKLQSNVPLHGF
jgi:hypothetical protein